MEENDDFLEKLYQLPPLERNRIMQSMMELIVDRLMRGERFHFEEEEKSSGTGFGELDK